MEKKEIKKRDIDYFFIERENQLDVEKILSELNLKEDVTEENIEEIVQGLTIISGLKPSHEFEGLFRFAHTKARSVMKFVTKKEGEGLAIYCGDESPS